MKRKQRVRVHLSKQDLPSVEGVLVSRRFGEYRLAVASLLLHPEAAPAQLESRFLVVPAANVAFYEVL